MDLGRGLEGHCPTPSNTNSNLRAGSGLQRPSSLPWSFTGILLLGAGAGGGGATGSLPCKGIGEVAASTGALQPQARAPGEDSDMPAPTTPLHPGPPAFRAGKDPPAGSPNISHDMHLLLSCRSAQQPMTQPNPAGSTVPTHGGLQLSIFPPPATTSTLGHHRAAPDSSLVRAQMCFEELPN